MARKHIDPGRLALLTPTYRADLERFRILREALEALGCDWPHVAVVQTEDLPAFRSALGSGRAEWLASADVLPAEVEATRRRICAWPNAYRKARRSLSKRLGWFPDAAYDGWHVQQIIKLAAPSLLPYSACVTLDSDVLPTAPLRESHYWRAGQAALMMEHSPSLRHWADAAARVLRLPCEAVRPLSFVAWPFVFHAEVSRGLHAYLERLHNRPWWRSLLDQRPGDLSEFTVYGAYAHLVAQDSHHFECKANGATRLVNTEHDRNAAPALIEAAFQDPASHFLVLKASRHWPVEPLMPGIRRLLAESAGTAAGAA